MSSMVFRNFINANTTMAMGSISEFFAGIKEELCRGMYEALKQNVLDLYSSMMDVMNSEITRANNLVTQSPQEWNSTAFSFIETIAESAFIPVAGTIITCLFAVEIVSMIDDRNHGHNISQEEWILFLSKLAVCLLVCGKAFDIVMGFFEISTLVSNVVRDTATSGSGNLSLGDLLNFAEPSVYDFGCVFSMIGNLLLVGLCWLITYALSIMIFFRVVLWFLEIFMYSAPASIPFSTFLNKEWGQTGWNYIRKILAVFFEGFLMMIAFGLYKFVVTNISGSGLISGSDFKYAMMMSVGCGAVLFILLSKVGTISSSIMNAH